MSRPSPRGRARRQPARALVGQQRQQEAGLGERVRRGGANAKLGPGGRECGKLGEVDEVRLAHNDFWPEAMAANRFGVEAAIGAGGAVIEIAAAR